MAPTVLEFAERISPVANVSYVPFLADASHDEILDDIYTRIRAADFIVCIPGTRPSFVDAEIAYAIALNKPIMLVVRTGHGIPNTAHRSYPCLSLEILRSYSFAPLIRFICYLHGNWRATLALYSDFPSWILSAVMAFPLYSCFLAMLVGSVVKILHLLSILVSLEYAVGRFTVAGWGVVFVVAAWLTAFMFVGVAGWGVMQVISRWGARRYCRRRMAFGEYNLSTLKTWGDPRAIDTQLIESFEKHDPQPHHLAHAP